MEILDQLALLTIAYDKGDARRIHHFLKVHAFARLIGIAEGLSGRELFNLEAAAYLHDIGIHQGEIRFGRNDGKIQEQLGPEEAKPLLDRLDITGADQDRILWLIAHHHSYETIDGLDAQILAEADMLVNPYEDGTNRESNQHLYEMLYKTKTGKKLFEELYLEEYKPGSSH
ncbi:HD domain-containing protein [Acidaminococcus sp.]|uniref:HD domain-containing protein n=1 Tax=Acidaminococcus sp. TaxID=1872103 RepID=UPI003D7D03DE